MTQRTDSPDMMVGESWRVAITSEAVDAKPVRWRDVPWVLLAASFFPRQLGPRLAISSAAKPFAIVVVSTVVFTLMVVAPIRGAEWATLSTAPWNWCAADVERFLMRFVMIVFVFGYSCGIWAGCALLTPLVAQYGPWWKNVGRTLSFVIWTLPWPCLSMWCFAHRKDLLLGVGALALIVWALILIQMGSVCPRSHAHTRQAWLPPKCYACGYWLKQLSFWGRCPECGVPIRESQERVGCAIPFEQKQLGPWPIRFLQTVLHVIRTPSVLAEPIYARSTSRAQMFAWLVLVLMSAAWIVCFAIFDRPAPTLSDSILFMAIGWSLIMLTHLACFVGLIWLADFVIRDMSVAVVMCSYAVVHFVPAFVGMAVATLIEGRPDQPLVAGLTILGCLWGVIVVFRSARRCRKSLVAVMTPPSIKNYENRWR